MDSGEELLSKILKALCSSKTLTTNELASTFKLRPEDIDLLLSILVGEGLLVRVEAGTQRSCTACPVGAWCGMKPPHNNLPTAGITYYRLSEAGLKACADISARQQP
ncbi:MAG: FeoC-like transcriptional regulator [Zestosphaera sp.]